MAFYDEPDWRKFVIRNSKFPLGELGVKEQVVPGNLTRKRFPTGRVNEEF
jgi:hypothetical protein